LTWIHRWKRLSTQRAQYIKGDIVSKHYLHETGSDLILDTGINIGTVSDKMIYFKKPSGLEGSWTGTLYSSYSDIAALTGTYFVKHTLAYLDLDISGEWRFNAYVAAADGTWWGETVKINIFDKYE